MITDTWTSSIVVVSSSFWFRSTYLMKSLYLEAVWQPLVYVLLDAASLSVLFDAEKDAFQPLLLSSVSIFSFLVLVAELLLRKKFFLEQKNLQLCLKFKGCIANFVWVTKSDASCINSEKRDQETETLWHVRVDDNFCKLKPVHQLCFQKQTNWVGLIMSLVWKNHDHSIVHFAAFFTLNT